MDAERSKDRTLSEGSLRTGVCLGAIGIISVGSRLKITASLRRLLCRGDASHSLDMRVFMAHVSNDRSVRPSARSLRGHDYFLENPFCQGSRCCVGGTGSIIVGWLCGHLSLNVMYPRCWPVELECFPVCAASVHGWKYPQHPVGFYEVSWFCAVVCTAQMQASTGLGPMSCLSSGSILI